MFSDVMFVFLGLECGVMYVLIVCVLFGCYGNVFVINIVIYRRNFFVRLVWIVLSYVFIVSVVENVVSGCCLGLVMFRLLW